MNRCDGKDANAMRNSDIFAFIWRAVMRTIMLGAILAVLISLFRPVWAHAQESFEPGEMIRLHVLANSDSDKDQAVKLCVRDAIRERVTQLCASAQTADEAYTRIQAARTEIEALALEELETQGFSYGAEVQLGIFEFPDRMYGDALVPAGDYRAVRVVIGAGQGHNWWCVLYPDLCFVDEACAEAAEADQPIVFYSSIWRALVNWFR